MMLINYEKCVYQYYLKFHKYNTKIKFNYFFTIHKIYVKGISHSEVLDKLIFSVSN